MKDPLLVVCNWKQVKKKKKKKNKSARAFHIAEWSAGWETRGCWGWNEEVYSWQLDAVCAFSSLSRPGCPLKRPVPSGNDDTRGGANVNVTMAAGEGGQAGAINGVSRILIEAINSNYPLPLPSFRFVLLSQSTGCNFLPIFISFSRSLCRLHAIRFLASTIFSPIHIQI